MLRINLPTASAMMFGLLVATASAQTPSDIAHLTWPQGVPAHSGSAPAGGSVGGSLTGQDLARLSAQKGVAVSATSAPRNGAVVANAFGPADLVRLSGRGASPVANVAAADSANIVVAGGDRD